MVTIQILMSLVVAISLAGCYGPAHYDQPPLDAAQFGTGKTPIKPDIYRVDSEMFPTYFALQAFEPPRYWQSTAVSEILRADRWQITHLVGERFIVQSKEYNGRQCRLAEYVNPFGFCIDHYEYGIYINTTGEIDGGWELLPSDRMVLGYRYMHMSWNPKKNAGWPTGRIFVPDQ